MRSLLLSLALLLPAAAPAQDLVAKTDALSPADEAKKFKLPPGFTAQLVASEPDIQKPMQMAFDAKGRLWLTTSHHYPWAAEPGKGTDKLFILSDFDAAGKAKKVQVFDDKLNIPIGVLPLPDGKSVIVSECGKILKLTDTDADMKADKREVLFDGFGFRDTHGMTNSFTLMPDGWVYACHGYLNDSTVKGTDGHEVKMNSGNTFRFKPDGSRIEVFTRGQVNPFGIAVDPWLNLYTADCHSKPVTQLIRGAHYDSFGKPHDGLGYAPHVYNHLHNSTGLCGLTYYAADHFPKEWAGVMFIGNVVTSRINCDRIGWKGSTPEGKELPDFLVSDDPWFRPVDIKLGPDGALYVSDFYNKIIGHYEVDLKHPGRDKDHGRVWRIVWTGEPHGHKVQPPPELAELKPLRELAAAKELSAEQRQQAVAALKKDARVARAAADVMTAHPHADFVEPLLDFVPHIKTEDTHLSHAARIALRNCVLAAGGVDKVKGLIDRGDRPIRAVALFDVAIAIRTKESGEFLAEHFADKLLRDDQRVAAAGVIGRYASDRDYYVTGHTFLGKPGDFGRWCAYSTALLRGAQAGGAKKAGPGRDIATGLGKVFEAKLPPEDQRAAAILFRLATSFPDSRPVFADAACTFTAVRLIEDATTPADVRNDLVEAIDPLNSKPVDSFRRRTLGDESKAVALRVRILSGLLARGAPSVSDCGMAKDLIKVAPYAQAVSIAVALAGDKFGADLLLASVRNGEVPGRLLQEKAVLDRLKATKVPDLDAKLKELTKNLPPAEKRLDDLIKARAAGFSKAKTDVDQGKVVFTKQCAVCHQLNNEGAKVGPQLDGVGIRGLERLLEDTLDPNRNVDHAFRATKLDLKDGRNLSGLLLREEGEVYVLADNVGKEQRIPKADVDQKTTANTSAMPANLDTVMTEAEYYHLLRFLLEQKVKK